VKVVMYNQVLMGAAATNRTHRGHLKRGNRAMHRRAAGQWGRLFDPVARRRRIKGFVDGSQDAMPVKKCLFIKHML
ncbi:MAG TPA: hypothetical protein VM659_11535, partial [Dongiaceae bacterium]|nr:hypothetical protein [Dongiaceae bacterium]